MKSKKSRENNYIDLLLKSKKRLEAYIENGVDMLPRVN